MSDLYRIAGVSKQAHQQYMARFSAKEDRSELYLQMIEQARLLHPAIGLLKIYHLYQPEGIGRDAFIDLATLAGYALEKPLPASWKGGRVIPYQNLLSGKIFDDIHQVWATDITYYRIKEVYYYISMIMDLYSRKILAASVADSLHGIHSLKLLRKAIREANLPKDHTLIHHSDKGTQYTALAYTQLLKKKEIGISMCNSVFENTSMERLNGIIKNDYLHHWQPKSFSHLKTLLKRAVSRYNNCPHGQLGHKTPNQFIQNLPNVPLHQRTKLKVYTSKIPKYHDPNQLNLFDQNLFIS
ncbi:MAG: DDE-type integrase/transposase/recombinase [Bacteroidetes bacterium]|nr:DDE-type integrase/transposase/recombinase [Bacteroidota bacterium]